MPELPEVETIKNQLENKIKGKKLDGKKIIAVKRRGKMLKIEFEDKTNLVFHLKLTGQLLIDVEPSKYTKKVFIFDDKTKLVFNDARKFGWFKEMKKQEFDALEKKLGPEPLAISKKEFRDTIKLKPNSKIKVLLMDQSVIVGIGNIYASEILFASGISPNRLVRDLQEDDLEKIFTSTNNILKKAIKLKGSSIRDYIDTSGNKGDYGKYHKVYQKEKCSVCGSKIENIKLSGRSSFFCPKCQL